MRATGRDLVGEVAVGVPFLSPLATFGFGQADGLMIFVEGGADSAAVGQHGADQVAVGIVIPSRGIAAGVGFRVSAPLRVGLIAGDASQGIDARDGLFQLVALKDGGVAEGIGRARLQMFQVVLETVVV